jgi:peptide deformylase
MLVAMLIKRGVGIAAPQIGRPERVCIIGAGHNLFMINPKIIVRSTEMITDVEGCLSCPGEQLRVPRAQSIGVEFYDLKEESPRQKKRISASFLLARIIQHEVDHLDGILIEQRSV